VLFVLVHVVSHINAFWSFRCFAYTFGIRFESVIVTSGDLFMARWFYFTLIFDDQLNMLNVPFIALVVSFLEFLFAALVMDLVFLNLFLLIISGLLIL